MTTLTLKRISFTREGVFGVLKDGPWPWLCTLEDPWNMNKLDSSCIPKGSYECVALISPSKGATFGVLAVPGRSDILFHAGNTVNDTQGCILLGKEFGLVDGLHGIRESVVAMKEFLNRMKNLKSFYLSIEE